MGRGQQFLLLRTWMQQSLSKVPFTVLADYVSGMHEQHRVMCPPAFSVLAPADQKVVNLPTYISDG